MPEQSLLTAEVRALVGGETPRTAVEVSERLVQRAQEVFLGRRGRPFAPGEDVPGYTMVALEHEDAPPLPKLMPDILLVSNEWQFSRPLRLGERLEVSTRLADLSERFGGRFGYSIHVRMDIECRDAAGDIVARSIRMMMQYDAATTGPGEE